MGNSCCGLPDAFGTERSPSSQYQTRKRKMNYTKPTQVTRGVSIKKNPKTGLYEGMPKQWIQNNDISINVDNSKTVATSHFSDSIRPTPVIPPKILNMIQSIPARHSLRGMPTQQPSYPIQNFMHK